MHQRWNDTAAAACTTELGLRVYSSRLIGSDPVMVLYGGGNTSVKLKEGDTDVLYVKGSGADLGAVSETDFTPLSLPPLLGLLEHEGLPVDSLVAALRPYVLRSDAPRPSIETLMHAVLPWKFVEHTHAAPVLAICNTAHSIENLRAAFGDTLVIVPYHHSGFDLARACAAAYAEQYRPGMTGMVLLHHGVCAWGKDARSSYKAMLGLAQRAEDFLRARDAWELDQAPDAPRQIAPAQALAIARLRREASRAAGRPLTVTLRDDPASLAFARRGDLERITSHGPATPGHAIFTKRFPQLGRDVAAFVARYQAHLARLDGARGIDCAPRVVLDAELGLLGLGINKFYADAAAEVYRSDAAVIARAEKLDAYATIAPDLILKAELEYAGFEARVAGRDPRAGRVILVADALQHAAAIQAELAAGGAVIALDTDPAVSTLAQAPGYLGLCAQPDSPADRARVLDLAIRAFGGIDRILHPSAWDALFQPLLEFAIHES